MNKLTAEKCRELLKERYRQRESGDISIGGAYMLQALEIALPVLEQQEKGELVWIYWDGESALPPVKDNVMVEIRMRSGNYMRAPAKTIRWRNYESHPGDIIAYRVIEQQEKATNQNGEQ